MTVPELPIVAVASGKGGGGKSSVAVAIGREPARAGLVDADIAGPDAPRMLGRCRDVPTRSVTLARWGRSAGMEAMEVDGLKVASAGSRTWPTSSVPVGASAPVLDAVAAHESRVRRRDAHV
jgi:Mrp family chromosome partitioning ATPase